MELAGLHQVIASPGRVSGSLEVFLRLVEETRRRRIRMVWIDPSDCLDPVTAFAQAPQHLVWARGGGLPAALQVADAVLRDENFPFVCLDGVLLEENDWRRQPLSRWYRLQRLANRKGACLILGTPAVTIPAAGRRWTVGVNWEFPDCFTTPRGELQSGVSLTPADSSGASERSEGTG